MKVVYLFSRETSAEEKADVRLEAVVTEGVPVGEGVGSADCELLNCVAWDASASRMVWSRSWDWRTGFASC